jgi:hypothetical protein
MSKNQIFKLEILKMINDNNLFIDDIILKKLNKSSKTTYSNLIIIKEDINKLLDNKIIDEKKNIIEMIELDKYNEIKNENIKMKTDLFNNFNLINDLNYKIAEYKKSISLLQKTNSDSYSDNNSNSDNIINDDNINKNKLSYKEIPKTSNIKLINEIIENSKYKYKDLIKMSNHSIKQLYNKINNNKYKRLF